MTSPFAITYGFRDPNIDPEFPWLSKAEADAFRGRHIMTKNVSEAQFQSLVDKLDKLAIGMRDPAQRPSREWVARECTAMFIRWWNGLGVPVASSQHYHQNCATCTCREPV